MCAKVVSIEDARPVKLYINDQRVGYDFDGQLYTRPEMDGTTLTVNIYNCLYYPQDDSLVRLLVNGVEYFNGILDFNPNIASIGSGNGSANYLQENTITLIARGVNYAEKFTKEFKAGDVISKYPFFKLAKGGQDVVLKKNHIFENMSAKQMAQRLFLKGEAVNYWYSDKDGQCFVLCGTDINKSGYPSTLFGLSRPALKELDGSLVTDKSFNYLGGLESVTLIPPTIYPNELSGTINVTVSNVNKEGKLVREKKSMIIGSMTYNFDNKTLGLLTLMRM
jgi:hypothetical protein